MNHATSAALVPMVEPRCDRAASLVQWFTLWTGREVCGSLLKQCVSKLSRLPRFQSYETAFITMLLNTVLTGREACKKPNARSKRNGSEQAFIEGVVQGGKCQQRHTADG